MNDIAADLTLGLPNLHDGSVLSLSIQDKDVQVVVRDTIKNEYRINFQNVYRLRADNFREGNIILMVEVLKKGFAEDGCLLRMLDLDRPSDAPFFINLVKDLESGVKKMLVIAPSYGCELSIICEAIMVSRL